MPVDHLVIEQRSLRIGSVQEVTEDRPSLYGYSRARGRIQHKDLVVFLLKFKQHGDMIEVRLREGTCYARTKGLLGPEQQDISGVCLLQEVRLTLGIILNVV
jgi:hypothetical protein